MISQKLLLGNVSKSFFARGIHNVKKLLREKPVVIILPWLGATKSGVEKYKSLYNKNGCDTIVHKPDMMDFIWPRTGIKNSAKFLKSLPQDLNGKPIIIHSFSIGCYFYALCLTHLNSNKKIYGNISQNIVGQIIDSPVVGSLNEMAFGVSKMLSNQKIMQKFLYQSCLGYFALSRPFTVKYYDDCIDEIKNRPIKTSAMVLSCRNDPMLQEQALLRMVESWKNVGCKTTLKIWDKSEHAQHLRIHKEEYEKLTEEFLEDILTKS